MSQIFCAERSLLSGDPLAGSAAHLEANLLISWPRAKWRRNLRQASDMPAGLIARLDRIAARGRRVNLIHRRHHPSELHRVYLMPERQAFDVPRASLDAFLGAWEDGASLDEWRPASVTHDLMLCCTHGKKDKCCAKFGFATYKALARAVDDHRLPFEVWESTHLGGCRLAASAILLSPVRKYGRIDPGQALALLRREAKGRRYLPCYRGSSALTPVQQCAELAALEHLASVGHDALVEITADQGDDHQRTLTLAWRDDTAQGELRVECRAQTVMRLDTCADLDEGPTPSLVWIAQDITE
ncbi:sucrase ferredoxin [Halomonas sp. V046]|uniref:sucrase ferredoxin n=1 Tax=Halomonas sp. V046 TaxID=3459611 RepID=UPI004043F07B